MGEEYMIGKDMAKFEEELKRTQVLMQEIYDIIAYNLKKENIEEPKTKEGK